MSFWLWEPVRALHGSAARDPHSRADPSGGNPLLRVAGLAEELSELLQMRVDVVADELLKAPVSASAHADAVPL